MAAGEFSKEFDVDVKNSNSDPEKDRVLFLNLTSVTGSKNPLLVLFVVTSLFYCEAYQGTMINLLQALLSLSRYVQPKMYSFGFKIPQ